MEYKALFDEVMYEKYDTSPLSDDDGFILKVKERTGNMKKTNFKFRRPAVIAASAAAAAALTVSVGAAVNYFHQQSVDTFFPDVSGSEPAAVIEIEEESPLTSANEHFRITLDKTYFDGENLTCIMTAESLDGTQLPRMCVYADHDGKFSDGTTYMLNYDMSADFHGIDTRSSSVKPFVVHISEHELRDLRGMTDFEGLAGGTYIRFNIYDDPNPQYFVRTEDGTYEPVESDGEWNVLGGIELYTDVEKNIDTTEVYSEGGDKLTLSQIGYYSGEMCVLPDPLGRVSIIEKPGDLSLALVLNDGTTRQFDKWIYSAWTDNSSYVLFPELIHLDDYMGIEISGIRYLKRS